MQLHQRFLHEVQSKSDVAEPAPKRTAPTPKAATVSGTPKASSRDPIDRRLSYSGTDKPGTAQRLLHDYLQRTN